MTESTFALRAAALLDTAREGDSVVVGTASEGRMVTQTKRGRAAIDLVYIARAVLDDAADALEDEPGVYTMRLARQVQEALDCLPDPHADDAGEDA